MSDIGTAAPRFIEEVMVSFLFLFVGVDGLLSGKATVVAATNISCFMDDLVSLRTDGPSGVGIKTCSGS